jgi:MFS family permease
MALLGSLLIFLMRTGAAVPRDRNMRLAEPAYTRVLRFIKEYRWLWLSAIIVTGATGGVTSRYPGFSREIPQVTALYISAMNLGTIAAVIIASRFVLSPVPAIRTGAVIIAASVFATYFTPWGFVLTGAAAGVVMIAQIAFLSESEAHQGTVMGIYTTASYAGMSLLPFIAGLVAENSSYFMAFLFTVFAVLTVPFTIGRCTGKKRAGAPGTSTGRQ